MVVQNEPVSPLAVSVLAEPNPSVAKPVRSEPCVPFANPLATVAVPDIVSKTHLSSSVGSMFRPLSLITRLISAPLAYVSGSNEISISSFMLPHSNGSSSPPYLMTLSDAMVTFSMKGHAPVAPVSRALVSTVLF